MNKYQKGKEAARAAAQDWQAAFSRSAMSWGELAQWQDHFSRLGRKYGLLREFAESLKAALDQFAEMVEEKHYITISSNALSNKSPMFIDGAAGEPVQVGYVITGKTDFQDDFGRWSGQYIDLWVEILSVSPVDFEGEAA